MDTQNKKAFAMITGASQGLGKAFATELAQRQYNLILISLPDQGLELLANDLKTTYGVSIYTYETNFSSDENIKSLTQHINESYPISILINNAGTGGTRRFDRVALEYINTIIQVNVKATALLTHQLLPNLKQQERSYILNVSSIAAFSPVGYKTVYPATKSFVHSFSLGLSEELKDTNVSVSVINPGAMKTNPEITARIEKQGFLGKLTLLEPRKVAKYSIAKMLSGKTLILVNPMSWLMSKLLPMRVKVPMMTRIVKREVFNG